MPELPDVEEFRRKSRKALNKKIKTAKINYKKLVKVSKSTINNHLKNNKLVGTDRIGKHLFLEISDGYYLVSHFGMTGNVSYWKKQTPKHILINLKLENNYNLSITSIRKLGHIDLVKSKQEYIDKHDLGTDALSIDKKQFLELLKNSKGMIKTTLMNQNKIAGIGNIYCDEILFQTKIYPKTKIKNIDKNKREQLYKNMKRVLNKAIEEHANTDKLPNSYIIPNRDKGKECPKCNSKLKRIKVNNRTTYYCPKCQS